MLTVSRIILPVFAIGIALGARAQNAKPHAPATPVEEQWKQLISGDADGVDTSLESDAARTHVVSGGQAAAAAPATATATPTPPPAVSPFVADYLARANKFQDFLVKNPTDSHCPEARRLEALSLLRAGFYGDTSQSTRCSQLVAQVRQDPSLSASDRYAVAAFADNAAVPADGSAPQAVRLAQYEKIARAHIKEFGSLPQTFESLLHVAQSCPDADAVRIANDLLKMPAPPDVQDGARNLLARHALVGTSLAALLGGALDASQLGQLQNGQTVIVFSWSTSVPGGVGPAIVLSSHAPSHCLLIGANLDPDPEAARSQAESLHLQGILLFGKAASTLSGQLKLAELPAIFTTDQKGMIRSVAATLPLASRMEQPAG